MQEPTLEELAAFVREQVGLDADRDRPSMAALAAIGLTVRAWRNTSLEDLHAGSHPSGGFPDSDMMRFNIATFRVVFEHVTSDAVDWSGLEAALTDSERALPGGLTVGAVAGEEFERLTSDIRAALAGGELTEQRQGFAYLLTVLTLEAGIAYKGWYGSPWWPDVVAAFIAFSADPDSSARQYDERRNAEPAAVSNRTTLAQILLDQPESLPDDAIYWCLGHGLDYQATFAGFARWRRRRDPDWVDPMQWLSDSSGSK